MTGRMLIDAGMFMKKSFKNGGGDRWRPTPSGFPLLQCLEFGGRTGGNESGDRLGLAQIVGLAPPENDRNGDLLRHGCFVHVCRLISAPWPRFLPELERSLPSGIIN
jgi:hypothetical protein